MTFCSGINNKEHLIGKYSKNNVIDVIWKIICKVVEIRQNSSEKSNTNASANGTNGSLSSFAQLTTAIRLEFKYYTEQQIE